MDKAKLKSRHMSSLYLLKACLKYFTAYKLRITVAMVSMGIVAASTAAVAYLMKPAIDRIFINKDETALLFLPFLLVLVIATKGVFEFLQKYTMAWCGVKVLEQLRNELYARIICLPMAFFSEAQVGMLMSRVINDIRLISKSLPAVIKVSSEIMTMFGLIGTVIYLDPFLAFWALLVFPLAIYPVVYFGKKLRKIGRKQQGKIADISSITQEIFSGMQVVKAFATEREEKDRFNRDNAKFTKFALKAKKYNQLSSPIMELVGALGAGLVIWYGGSRVISGESTPGTFFAFLTALIMLYKPFKSISSANMDIQNALAGAERVFEILDSDDVFEESGGGIELEQPFESLELDRITFAYPGCDQPALKDISLAVRSGEKVALVGPSGAGKTTLVHLIPRFFDCQQGTIRINGRPVSDYTLKSLRRSIGIVTQDPFLFNATVRENIAYGQNGIDQDRVEAAARAAYAHDFVNELEQGYDAVIGERGVKLSGGQKQRLTIARALLKNPPLLILDEATSALDTESERIVQQALENLMRDRTSIVIAHRLSTVLSADRIVVMADGRIQDVGRHEELLESSPLYAKLYQMQFQDEVLEGDASQPSCTEL